MFFAVASACRTSGGSWVAAIATPRTTSAAPRTIHMGHLPPACIQGDGIAAPPSRVNPRRHARATPGRLNSGAGRAMRRRVTTQKRSRKTGAALRTRKTTTSRARPRRTAAPESVESEVVEEEPAPAVIEAAVEPAAEAVIVTGVPEPGFA